MGIAFALWRQRATAPGPKYVYETWTGRVPCLARWLCRWSCIRTLTVFLVWGRRYCSHELCGWKGGWCSSFFDITGAIFFPSVDEKVVTEGMSDHFFGQNLSQQGRGSDSSCSATPHSPNSPKFSQRGTSSFYQPLTTAQTL